MCPCSKHGCFWSIDPTAAAKNLFGKKQLPIPLFSRQIEVKFPFPLFSRFQFVFLLLLLHFFSNSVSRKKNE